MQDAIDWRRLRVLWSPSRGANPSRMPSSSPGPVASSPDSGGRQSQSVRGAAAEGPTSPQQVTNQVLFAVNRVIVCLQLQHSLFLS